MGNRRVHLRIRGLVQGVAFRASAVAAARPLGVFGWVRNQPDGGVESIVEGEAGAVERFVDWCRRGPSHAQVESVSADDEPFRGEFDSFVVAR